MVFPAGTDYLNLPFIVRMARSELWELPLFWYSILFTDRYERAPFVAVLDTLLFHYILGLAGPDK